MRILIHACCGPCLSGVVTGIRQCGWNWDVFAYFYNPNIHPFSEWLARRRAFFQVLRKLGVDGYAPWVWDATRWLRECILARSRCECCYEMRLREAARFAAEHGFSSFTTTLTISPYQPRELIWDVGRRVAEKFGVEFLPVDFTEFYPNVRRMVGELGIYSQKYCGCILSEAEAWAQRMNARWLKI